MKALDAKVKYLSIAIAMIVIVALAYAYGFHQGTHIARVSAGEETGFRSLVIVKVFKPDGTLVYEYETHNVVMTQAAKRVRDFFGWGNASAPSNITKYISLSETSGDPAKTNTQLPGELTADGLERTAGTVAWNNATSYNCTNTFTYTGTSTKTIRSVGLNSAAYADAPNTLQFGAAITDAPLSQNDQLQVKWIVNVPDG